METSSAYGMTTFQPFMMMAFNDSYIIKFLCVPNTKYVLHMSFCIVLGLIGTVGNLSLLCVILSNRGLWKTVNLFIFNLSLANFLFIVLIVPLQIEQEVHVCWLASLTSCRVRYVFPVLFQSAAIFSLVALSRERYIAIISGLHPDNKPRNTKLSLVIVSLIWLLAFLSALPLWFMTSKPESYMCIPYQTFGDSMAQTYQVCSFIFLYLIPLCIICGHYIPIVKLLIQSTSVQLTERSNNNQARKRLAIIILVITGTFAILWLPHFIYIVFYHFTSTPENNFPQHVIYYMQVINSCLDPWVVFIMSSSYRRHLLDRIRCSRIRKTFQKPTRTATSSSATNQNAISSRHVSTKVVTVV